MPCTRSMRSKTSKKKEDMPPPEDPEPPKTRTARAARSKKEEKKPKKDEEVDVPVPLSPTVSAASTRSTRSKKQGRGKGKNKAHPQPAEVIVVDIPSSPDVQPVPRTTRQKPAASKVPKTSKSKKDAAAKVVKSKDASENKIINVADNEEEFSVPIVPKTRTRGRTKRPAPVVESTSEDVSDVDEEINVAQAAGNMTFEHMKNSFIAPIKTVFQSLDVDLEKIFGKSPEEQEREFNALLAEATSMPPPPPPRPPLPVPKGKGRAKRGRSKSPEKTTQSKTDVPKSFNFSQKVTEAQIPAQKKMLLDVPSSDEDIQPVSVSSNDACSPGEIRNSTAANASVDNSPVQEENNLTPKALAQDPNATYVLPEDSKKDSKQGLNVTVSLKKSQIEDSISSPRINEEKETSPKAEDMKCLQLPEKVESTSIPGQTTTSGSDREIQPTNTKNVMISPTLSENSPCPQKTLDVTPKAQDPNATYILPQDSKKEPVKRNLNVTVCVKKGEDVESSPPGNSTTAAVVSEKYVTSVPILPPPVIPPPATSSLLFSQDLSRTFVKEPPLESVVEEEEGASSTKSDKGRPPVVQVKPMDPNKKGLSSSSSASSNASMKSATSQPCLSASKKLVSGSSGKNGPIHGSAGKLNEVQKSKTIEEAERRKQEIIRQRQENSKKQMEEWKKKTEKIKQEEEKKKQKIIQQASSNLLKKLNPPIGPTLPHGTVGALPKPVFAKPKLHFGSASSNKVAPFGAVPNLPPSLPKHGFPPKPVVSVVPETETDLDDSFKTASPPNSFMETTVDMGHLSSYDITVYEDLDEDLRHRENKTIPTWASDKEALKTALFSMVLLPEYQYSLPDCFPRPDKSYKLFPNKNYPM